jgi:hypothetical protein
MAAGSVPRVISKWVTEGPYISTSLHTGKVNKYNQYLLPLRFDSSSWWGVLDITLFDKTVVRCTWFGIME